MTQIPIKRVLSIDLCSRGFGFAVLESPDRLIDWGVKQVRRNKQAGCRAMAARLIQLYEPETLIVENCDHRGSKRCPRIRNLVDSLCEQAQQFRVETCRISPNTVRAMFSEAGASTKYAIAQHIAENMPELSPRLPPVRKPWMSEDYRMSFFDATAFALTYYYLVQQTNQSFSSNCNSSNI